MQRQTVSAPGGVADTLYLFVFTYFLEIRFALFLEIAYGAATDMRPFMLG